MAPVKELSNDLKLRIDKCLKEECLKKGNITVIMWSKCCLYHLEKKSGKQQCRKLSSKWMLMSYFETRQKTHLIGTIYVTFYIKAAKCRMVKISS